MFACEMCGREFKNRSGLSGHKRMIHYSESTSEYSTQELGQHSRSARPSTIQALGERLEQQHEVLGRVLERLDETLGSEVNHTHGSSCHECHQFAEQVLEQGRVAGINEIAEIPGVKEAVAFASSTKRWNEEHADHAIDENWASVPGVRDLIENSQPKLVTITRGDDPAADNRGIRVVRSPEGDLRRREMFKVEVKRHVNDMIKPAVARSVGEIINEISRNRNQKSG